MPIKVISLFIIFLLILTVITVTAQPDDEPVYYKNSKNLSLSFSEAEIKTVGDFISIDLEAADTYTFESGEPVLPVIIKTFVFPKGTIVNNIDCVFSDFSDIKLDKKVIYAPEKEPLFSIQNKKETLQDQMINYNTYLSNDFYPEQAYSYNKTCGIDGLTLSIRLYPARYIPAQDTLHIASNVDINILYDVPTQINTFKEERDLVIIAPSKFSRILQPLIDHKNNCGIVTFLKKTEDIYRQYKGRDKPEQIKYFIKDALDTYNISYVLLVGGLKGQNLASYHTLSTDILKGRDNNWYVPVRYANNNDGWEVGYITDLYYADIYDSEYKFSSWDTNDDGIFDYFSYLSSEADKKDIIDFSPDVYVGRLPCRNKQQVKTIVDKIITYETKTFGSDWFNTTAVIAGDTFNPARGGTPGIYEGELETGVTVQYMSSINHKINEVWASTGNLSSLNDVIDVFQQGAGFIHMTGHGNPSVWSVPATDSYNANEWILDVFRKDMRLFKNGEKLPILIVGGCHNSQFEVNLMNLIRDFLKEPLKYFKISPAGRFYYMEWISDCWSWHLTRLADGGTIATIGNTGLGYGYPNSYCTSGLDGWLEPRFFYQYTNGASYLGEAHSGAIKDYINIIGYVNNDQVDRKTIEEWVLFGDPSLKIGGYP